MKIKRRYMCRVKVDIFNETSAPGRLCAPDPSATEYAVARDVYLWSSTSTSVGPCGLHGRGCSSIRLVAGSSCNIIDPPKLKVAHLSPFYEHECSSYINYPKLVHDSQRTPSCCYSVDVHVVSLRERGLRRRGRRTPRSTAAGRHDPRQARDSAGGCGARMAGGDVEDGRGGGGEALR